MNPSEKETMFFIDIYRSFQLLWDRNHPNYTNKTKRNDALTEMSIKLNSDVKTVKNKIKSLRSYLCKEHQKVLKRKSNSGDEDYSSMWFAYESLSFITDSITHRETKETTNTKENFTESTESLEAEAIDEISNSSQTHKKDHEENQQLRSAINIKNTNHSVGEDESYDVKRTGTIRFSEIDEWNDFGQLMARKIRKLNPRNQLVAERHITNFLLDLQTQEMNEATDQMHTKPLHHGIPSVPQATVSLAALSHSSSSKSMTSRGPLGGEYSTYPNSADIIKEDIPADDIKVFVPIPEK